MARKVPAGLFKRGSVWHYDKQVRGARLRGSCETGVLAEAEAHLLQKLTEHGVSPPPAESRPPFELTFLDAATRYLNEYAHKKSSARDAQALRLAAASIGRLPLRHVHDGTLRPWVRERLAAGIKPGTINRDLAVVRRVLNLSARKWRAGNEPWLPVAPLVEMLPNTNPRKPYPLSFREQTLLLAHLPPHLVQAALFAVNTGCREAEVVSLQWSWEFSVPELGTSVFIIPGDRVKNAADRLVVLNSIARAVVDARRGIHADSVFTYARPHAGPDGRPGPVTQEPFGRLYNSAWKRGRRDAAAAYEAELGAPLPEGFRRIRVHDLKHTFGRRLRAASVGFEDRRDLLGHKTQRITTHYSAPDIQALIFAAERVVAPRAEATLVRLIPTIPTSASSESSEKLP